jgi:hypothetical protein
MGMSVDLRFCRAEPGTEGSTPFQSLIEINEGIQKARFSLAVVPLVTTSPECSERTRRTWEGLNVDFDASITQFASTQIKLRENVKANRRHARWISTWHRE